ncbi:MAG TPA: phosphotransferase [Acidimicrobiia bacterium]|nr:phosphotransferase [Acidimicrobiia bacterium]
MTPEEALALVRAASGLDAQTAEEIPGGWYSHTFAIDDTWIVRFPRSDPAAQAMEREHRLLPALATAMDFPVPLPSWSGRHAGRFFFGYRRIAGRPLRHLDDVVVARLAAMLTGLHRFDPAEAAGLLGVSDPVGTWSGRYEGLRSTTSERVAPLLDGETRRLLDRQYGAFLEALDGFEPVLVHGDLGTDHLLVDGTRIGMIDFGSAAMGDGAIDFVGLWITFGKAAALAVFGAYGGPVGQGFLDRMKAYVWLGAVQAVLYGLDTGQDEIVASGISKLGTRLAG